MIDKGHNDILFTTKNNNFHYIHKTLFRTYNLHSYTLLNVLFLVHNYSLNSRKLNHYQNAFLFQKLSMSFFGIEFLHLQQNMTPKFMLWSRIAKDSMQSFVQTQ